MSIGGAQGAIIPSNLVDLRLRGRGQFRCWARSFLFGRPELYEFCFQASVWIFPIGATHFFIVSNVLHATSRRAFQDACFICHFENPRRFFAADREGLVVLIDR